MTADQLEPNTPVLVGVGQFSERVDDADYQGRSAVDLGAAALRAAIADSCANAGRLARDIDTVAAVRQFETSARTARAPLGRSNNFPRSVAARIGAEPRRAILDVAGGQSPQHLVTEMAAAIASGRSSVAVVVGAEAISTARHLSSSAAPPDFTEHVDGDLEDRGYGHAGLGSSYQTAHGLTSPAVRYALLENARRARMKRSRAEYAREMGALFTSFTGVAAANPHAAARIPRSAPELTTVTGQNRMIVDPYPRWLVSRDQVNQAAAVVLTSVGVARELGVPEERWTFLHGYAELRERNLLDRADLGAYPAAVLAVENALRVAEISLDDLTSIDLYSCFPIAVSSVCDGLGLSGDDPRGLTVTGGLPYFGGPGNNYSLHAIAETVDRVRATPGGYGLVGANGGYLSKYAVGIYSCRPVPWQISSDADLQHRVDGWAAPVLARRADGWARIESCTVTYDRNDRAVEGIVVGRLEDTDERFLARTLAGDDQMLQQLLSDQPVGTRVYSRALGVGNRVALDRDRMAQLLPTRPAALRNDFDHILVRRAEHVLEITINRPERRNALHPPANDELEEAFDAFFADPELWVAILTGAGERAFCAGNDLVHTAQDQPMWIPVSGFGGLTSRSFLPKPVIAAVNGVAYGGGFEIALACHLVVADIDARFALSEARVGLAAGAGGLARLPRAVPAALANELVLTGRAMSADEAHRHGLVNRVAGSGAALAAARELAADIVKSSPTSVRGSLRMMAEAAAISDVAVAAARYSPALDDVVTSEDAAEGVAAFAEKRAPRWLNR